MSLLPFPGQSLWTVSSNSLCQAPQSLQLRGPPSTKPKVTRPPVTASTAHSPLPLSFLLHRSISSDRNYLTTTAPPPPHNTLSSLAPGSDPTFPRLQNPELFSPGVPVGTVPHSPLERRALLSQAAALPSGLGGVPKQLPDLGVSRAGMITHTFKF